MDRRNIQVIQIRQCPCFPLEARNHPGPPGDFRAENLDRQPAVQLAVPDFVHVGKPAAAEETDYLETGTQGPAQARLKSGI